MNFEDTLKNNEKVNGVSNSSNSIVKPSTVTPPEPEKPKGNDLLDFFDSPSTTTTIETKSVPKEEVQKKSGLDLNDLFAPSTNNQPSMNQSWNQPQQPWQQTQQQSWNSQQSWNNQQPQQQKQTQQVSSNPFDDIDVNPTVNNNSWNQQSMTSNNPFETMNQQAPQQKQQNFEKKNDPFSDFTQLDTFKTMQPKKSAPKPSSNNGSFGHNDDIFSQPMNTTTPPTTFGNNPNTNKVNTGGSFGHNDDFFTQNTTKPQQQQQQKPSNNVNGNFGSNVPNKNSFDNNSFKSSIQQPKLNHVNKDVQQSSNGFSQQNVNVDGNNAKGNLQVISGQESDQFSWENNFFSGASNIDDLRGNSKDEFDTQFTTISAKNVTPFGSTSNWQ